MPQIIVMADHEDAPILHKERVNVADFESQHFATQLVERLGWAVGDADELERATPHRPARAGRQRPAPPRSDASVVTTAS
jgi:hypothetical protein